MSFLFVPASPVAGGLRVNILYLTTVFLCFPLWLQGWPLVTLQEEVDVTKLFPGSGVSVIAPQGYGAFLFLCDSYRPIGAHVYFKDRGVGTCMVKKHLGERFLEYPL